jgi:ABC-type Fe3+ transport system permease subunit
MHDTSTSGSVFTWPIAPWVLLAGGVLLATIGLVAFLVTLFRHLRHHRQLLHTERVKAIEHGRPSGEPSLADAKFMHNAFWIAFWMVAIVPGAAFSSAASVTEGEGRPLALILVSWICASLASITAVVCATVVLALSRSQRPTRVSPRLAKGDAEERGVDWRAAAPASKSL